MSAPFRTSTPPRARRTSELIFAGPESLKARSVPLAPQGVPVPPVRKERRGKK